jgi:hypothetical protein
MEFATFYVGPGLAPHLQACLRSWVDYGHSIDVYTYDPALQLPPGVGRKDAGEILPSSAVYTYRTGMGRGSVAAFSNEFRYRLCQARSVIWVDTDVLCLSSHWPERDYQIAWQTPDHDQVNIAVFGAPRESELIVASLERIQRVGLATAEFGQLGPVPFTKTLQALGLEHVAAESWEFYPIGFNECNYFLDPDMYELAEKRVVESYALHLWNEVWTRARIPTFLRPPRGSYMESVYERHGIVVPVSAHLEDLSALTFVDPSAVVPLDDYRSLSTWAASMEQELTELHTWAASLETQIHESSAQRESASVRQRLRWLFKMDSSSGEPGRVVQ